MSKIKLPLAVLSIFITGLYVIEVNADHAWGRYHWDLSTLEPLMLSGTFTDNNTEIDGWMSSLRNAGSAWNSDSALQNSIDIGSNDPASCYPTAGLVEVCNDAYGDNGWLGIASIWATRGKSAHIVQGTVRVNDTYFDTEDYGTPAWRDFVMCQEVGHTFGLNHQDEDFANTNLGTCMDYTNNPGGTINNELDNRYPNQHDYDELAAIYAHLNETTTDSAGNGKGKGKKPQQLSASDNKSPNTPSEWGRAISQDAQGRDSVFERILGNGQILVTHVLWAI